MHSQCIYKSKTTTLYSEEIVGTGYWNPYSKVFRAQFDGVNKLKTARIWAPRKKYRQMRDTDIGWGHGW